MKRYCVMEKAAAPIPRKFFRYSRPKANPEHQRIEMPSSFRSDENNGSIGNDIGSCSSCSCIAEENSRKYNDQVIRDKLFDTLRAHLDDECPVNEKELKNSADHTPLHDAVRADNEEMVESLLKKETNVDSTGKYHLTPLHVAVYRGNVRIAKILLAHGASVDSKCILEEHTFVPMDLAIIGRHTSVIKLLRSHGCNNDVMKNYNWRSPQLISPDKYNNAINIYVLMAHLDHANKKRKTCLFDAVDSSMLEYSDIVRYLLLTRFEYYACPHNSGILAILRLLVHRAVERGYTQVVKDFLIWGAEIDIINYTDYGYHISDFTLLHNAVLHRRHDIAKLLIDHGADVNAKDTSEKSPFSYAFERSNVKMLDLLLTNGARENKEVASLLLTAVTMSKSTKFIEVLLRNGFQVNSRDELEKTPLHIAVQYGKMSNAGYSSYGRFNFNGDTRENSEESTNGNVKILKLLLRYGADVSARDHNCKTPLDVAAQSGNIEAVKTLLEHYAVEKGGFADIEGKNDVRANALILAAEMNNEKIVKMLLNYGADINFKRDDGKTALIRATERKHEKVVKLLLEHYADIEVTNSFGLTAIDVAFKRFSLFNAVSYSRIIMLLLKCGADVRAINSVHASTCTSGRMPKCLQKEIIKLKAANMYVDERKFQSIINSSALRSYREICEDEVDKMKAKKMCNSNVSVYDILTKDPDRLAFICRNRQIVKTLEAENYQDVFPNFHRMIENNFLKGQKRQILLDRALCSFSRLIDYEVLDVLSADMLIYLCNDDLKSLAEASTL